MLYHDARTLFLAMNIVVIIALQAHMNGFHRSDIVDSVLHLMQCLVLLRITLPSFPHLAECTEVLALDMEIHRIRFYALCVAHTHYRDRIPESA